MNMKPISLTARKSFKGIKKGQTFEAVILSAFTTNLIEFAVLKMEDGEQLDVPYNHFTFAEDQE
jgi:hypothetical protein